MDGLCHGVHGDEGVVQDFMEQRLQPALRHRHRAKGCQGDRQLIRHVPYVLVLAIASYSWLSKINAFNFEVGNSRQAEQHKKEGCPNSLVLMWGMCGVLESEEKRSCLAGVYT